ncbi:MAG: 3-oxoacyl-ACP reductase FabG [Candidatus Tectomicrobia bacterium]|nr:3-oxoacyl-ACP reductase FabG [Candidatus Tectomicrobia bacterium]
MAGRLEGKVAFVTGAAQGIGWVYAQGLAKEGARVVLNDVLDCQGPAKKLKGTGAETLGVEGDVTNPAAMEAAVKKTVETFGRVDILVNNAALYAGIERGSMFDISLTDWERVLKVNVVGLVIATKAAAAQMKKQKSGKIVNIASAVHDTGIPAFIHYTASKSAVVGMTRAMARELGPHGINVNSISPGYVDVKSNDPLPRERHEDNVKLRCIKRHQYPEDLVGTMIFLSSPESDFVTGQNIIVDGGIAFG